LELSGCGVERASLLVFLRLKTWGGGGKILPPPDLKPGGRSPLLPPVSYAYGLKCSKNSPTSIFYSKIFLRVITRDPVKKGEGIRGKEGKGRRK